mmetsp:Transcript_22217/g.39292  ORF Transcript_22217/g.39292 Transcript_22217/m.39292 type:complete len:191 (-) Transcript_22217:160-732(-)|eukprot:CAMPEP_0171489952 /NCGR_PEP_ID=MMETSP0958-20121227/3043_1 /TAXON_ID=87120 /ORGANISM="Aurantiochytrium limacinum, Strain ATCCMYA-1381" /LENGTH=190 /DNA_ID=CAMNT_0012023223 /DNA_START=333 /DNA_END=905 /DNA_ORIENTATION=+
MDSLFAQIENPVVRELFYFLSSDRVSRELQDFLEDHCDLFEGTLDDLTGEQDLERYSIYKEYTALLDGHMKEFCKEHGYSAKEVYEECNRACEKRDDDDENGESLTRLLLDMLIAASEYQAFVVNMMTFKRIEIVKAEIARVEHEQAEREKGQHGKGESKFADDFVAESKSSYESKYDRGAATPRQKSKK